MTTNTPKFSYRYKDTVYYEIRMIKYLKLCMHSVMYWDRLASKNKSSDMSNWKEPVGVEMWNENRIFFLFRFFMDGGLVVGCAAHFSLTIRGQGQMEMG